MVLTHHKVLQNLNGEQKFYKRYYLVHFALKVMVTEAQRTMEITSFDILVSVHHIFLLVWRIAEKGHSHSIRGRQSGMQVSILRHFQIGVWKISKLIGRYRLNISILDSIKAWRRSNVQRCLFSPNTLEFPSARRWFQTEASRPSILFPRSLTIVATLLLCSLSEPTSSLAIRSC